MRRAASSGVSPQLRPAHLSPAWILLLGVGGAAGTAVRVLLVEAFPAGIGVPWTVFGINGVGAFLLGLLLESLARRGPETPRHATLRLLLGTGFLGGLTTYSALALDVVRLVGVGSAAAGVGYAAGSLAVGVVAAAAGVALGGHLSGVRR